MSVTDNLSVTTTKPTHIDGAGHDDSDAEGQENQSGDDEELAPKKKRTRTALKCKVVKRWCVTGDRAEKDDDEIQVELEN